MRTVLLAAILLPAAAAAAVVINGEPRATSTGIAFDYTVPEAIGNDACTWQVSRVDDFGPAYQPENDVNPALFTDADKDKRNALLIDGAHRTFVFGDAQSKRGLDGYVYSRAAKAATVYYFKGTCGEDTVTFSASTKTVPFGITRGTVRQADPDHPGEYLYPSRKWNIAGQKVIDPQTGVEITYPIASGGAKSNTVTGASFKDANSTAWTGAGNTTADDSNSAAIAGDTGILYLRWDYTKRNIFGSGARTDYDSSGLDYLKINIKGMGTAAADEDRTIQVCLTIDGESCAGPWWDSVLPTSMGTAPAVGTGVPGDTLQGPGAMPFNRTQLAKKSGTFTYAAATQSVTLTTGTTKQNWGPGTQFRAYQPTVSGFIKDATQTAPIEISLDAHGLNTGDTVSIAGITGNTAANGSWTITVNGANTFTLDGSMGNGPFGGTRMQQVQVIDVTPGTPCVIHVWQESPYATGDQVKITELAGITDVVGNIYSVTVGTGTAGNPAQATKTLALDGSSCSGTFDNTTYARGNSTGRLFRLAGTAQKYSAYPIATVDSPTQITLQSGPGEDVTTPMEWTVAPAGILIRKKTASADTVSVQYVSVDYQTSPGYAGGAAGGGICGVLELAQNDGTKGHICHIGGPVLLTTSGSFLPLGWIDNQNEFGASSSYPVLASSDPTGAFGINPNHQRYGYVAVGGERFSRPGDMLIEMVVLDGDLADADPTKGQNSYYNGYAGYPYHPNCNGLGGTAAGSRVVPEGVTCGKYYRLGWARDLVQACTNCSQLWKTFAADLTNVYFTNANAFGVMYVPQRGKVHISLLGYSGQDTPGVVYVFEIDDSMLPPAVTVVGEVSTMNRDNADWSVVHGSAGVRSYAPGYVGWLANPMLDSCGSGFSNYYPPFGSTCSANGPYETSYTAVNGYGGVQMTNSKPTSDGGANDYGLQSCAAWAGSPYLPATTPDGVSTFVNGFLAGCTRLTLASEACDPTPSAMQTTMIAADPVKHETKCGAPGQYWPGQDLKVGDIVAFPRSDSPSAWCGGIPPYVCLENARVIARSGNGPGAEIVVYRGGVLPNAFGTYGGSGGGAQDFTAFPSYRKVIAYTNHPDTGEIIEAYTDYLNHGFDQAGGRQLVGFGHGNRTAIGVAGNDGSRYAAMFADFDTQLTSKNAVIYARNLPCFAGKCGNNIVSIDSHVTWVPKAHENSRVPFMLDGRPWNGYQGVSGIKVASGSANTYLFKWPQSTWQASAMTRIYPKHMPVAFRLGTQVLRSVSGAASYIDDSKPYTFCYAYRAGECRDDAAAGDLYADIPGFTQTGAEFQSGTVGNDKLAIVDPAFTAATSIVSSYFQQLLTDDMSGRNGRMLTSGFERYRLETGFKNWSITADGRFGIGITTGLERVRSEIWMATMPPVSTDSWDRTTFINWPITVPRGGAADNAVIEFGYSYYGDVTAGKLNCIDRDDTCVAAGGQDIATNPYWFASADTYTGVPCANGCTVNVPVVGNQMLYYRIRWRKGTNTVNVSPLRVLATP